jgi:hypothetical protein
MEFLVGPPRTRKYLGESKSYLVRDLLKAWIYKITEIAGSAPIAMPICNRSMLRALATTQYPQIRPSVRASCTILPLSIDGKEIEDPKLGWRTDSVDTLYKREQCIGSSAFGKVYLGTHLPR